MDQWRSKQKFEDLKNSSFPAQTILLYWRSPLASSLSTEFLDRQTSASIQHLIDQQQSPGEANVAVLARLVDAITLQQPLAPTLLNTLYSTPHWNSFVVGGGGGTSQRKLATQRALVRRVLNERQTIQLPESYRALILPTTKVAEIRGILLGARILRLAWMILITLVPWYPAVVYTSLLNQLRAVLANPGDAKLMMTFNLSWQPPPPAYLPYPAVASYRDDSSSGVLVLINEGRLKLWELLQAELIGSLTPTEMQAVDPVSRRIQIAARHFTHFPELDFAADSDGKIVVPEATGTDVRSVIDEILAGGYRFWSEAKPQKDAPLFSIVANAYLKVSVDNNDQVKAFVSNAVPFGPYRDENVAMMTEKSFVYEPGQWLRVLSFVHRQLMMGCEAYGAMGLDNYWRYRYTMHATAIVRDKTFVDTLETMVNTQKQSLQKVIESNDIIQARLTPPAHFLDSLASTLAKSVTDVRKDFDALAPKGTPFLPLYRAFVIEALEQTVAFSTAPKTVLHAGSLDRGSSTLSTEQLVAEAMTSGPIRKTIGFTPLIPNLDTISKMWFEQLSKRPRIFQLPLTTTTRLILGGDLRNLPSVFMASTRQNDAFHDLDGPYWATGFVEAVDLRGCFTAIAEFSQPQKFSSSKAHQSLTPVGTAAFRQARDIYNERAKPLGVADGSYAMSLYVDVRQEGRPFPSNQSLEFAAVLPFASLQRQYPSVWATVKEEPSLLDEGELPHRGSVKAPITSAQGVSLPNMRGWYAIDADQLSELWTKTFNQPKTVGRISTHYKTQLPGDDNGDDEDFFIVPD